MPAVDAVFSIGPTCRAAHQLDRVYGEVRHKGIFDWQVTPLAAIHAYLDRDFRGLFERGDLEIRKGVVWNARFGTSHMHEFPAELTPAGLDAHYDEARSRHDYLCGRARRLLRTRRRVLLAYSELIEPQDLEALAAHLRDRSPRLRFHLIAETPDCADGSGWEPGNTWRGSTAAWDSLLAPYRISLLRRLSMRLKRYNRSRKKRRAK